MRMVKSYSFDSLWCPDMFQAKQHHFKDICHRKKVPKTIAHVDIHVGDHILWPSQCNVARTRAMTMVKRYSFDSLWCLDMFQAKQHLFKHICHCEKVSKTIANVDIHVSDHILWPLTRHITRTRAMTMVKSYSFDSLWCLDMFQVKEHRFKHICHCEKVSKTIAHVDIHVSGRILGPSRGHISRI